MDRDNIERVRSASFTIARKGYEKREVERFLSRLADWLETGGADQARADVVRRELERVGEKTGSILTDAHDAAEKLREEIVADIAKLREDANAEIAQKTTDADEYAERTREAADAYDRDTRRGADEYSQNTHSSADDYAKTARREADNYASETRSTADRDAEKVRSDSNQEGRRIIADAEAKAQRIVDEGSQRRRDVESVIADLIKRRDSVLGDIEKLTGELRSTVGGHSSASFAAPEVFDPAEREAARELLVAAETGAESGDADPVASANGSRPNVEA